MEHLDRIFASRIPWRILVVSFFGATQAMAGGPLTDPGEQKIETLIRSILNPDGDKTGSSCHTQEAPPLEGVPSVGPASPAVPAAQADKGVDHSNQFSGPSRNQGAVGACHSFTAVAILEAAYFRRYGERLQLSEADLFLRQNVLGRTGYSGFLRNGDPMLEEGNWIDDDIQFAIDHGVATSLQYEAFVQRYSSYRDAESKDLRGIERQHQQNPWYVRMLYNPRKHWVKMQEDPVAQRILQNFLTGNDQALEAQREEVRSKLKGFRLSTKKYGPFNPKDCRQRNAKIVEDIVRELKAGRPVAIDYQTRDGPHASVVHGYRVTGNGSVILQTRNSWGENGDNGIPADWAGVLSWGPDADPGNGIPAKLACFITSMSTVDEGR